MLTSFILNKCHLYVETKQEKGRATSNSVYEDSHPQDQWKLSMGKISTKWPAHGTSAHRLIRVRLIKHRKVKHMNQSARLLTKFNWHFFQDIFMINIKHSVLYYNDIVMRINWLIFSLLSSREIQSGCSVSSTIRIRHYLF